jgi:predicted FMN-binding regulatory protein PaiB
MTEGRADAGLGYQIDGQQKMSQNRNVADRAGIIE